MAIAIVVAACGGGSGGGGDRDKQLELRLERAHVEWIASRYTAWAEAHPGGCPDTLDELAASWRPPAPAKDSGTADTWGHPLRWSCHGDRFDLASAGPDGRFDTDDDIASQEIAPAQDPDAARRVLELKEQLEDAERTLAENEKATDDAVQAVANAKNEADRKAATQQLDILRTARQQLDARIAALQHSLAAAVH